MAVHLLLWASFRFPQFSLWVISKFVRVCLCIAVASYDPLRCFTLFLRDPLGEQTSCQLKAPSALTCHRYHLNSDLCLIVRW